MATELVLKSKDGQRNVTTSFIVAEVFQKRHASVLRDIENLSCSKEFRELNFVFLVIIREFPQGGSKKDPYYEITKDGFSFLAMGYKGEKAGQFKEKIIFEFNKMESLLQNEDYIIAQALVFSERKRKNAELQLMEKSKQLEIAENTIKENQPKVEYHDNVLKAKQGITATIIAKDLGMSAVSLDNLLHKHGVIFKVQETWVLYQKYADRGYTITKTFVHTDSNGKNKTEIHTYWTETGRKFIMDGVKKLRETGKIHF